MTAHPTLPLLLLQLLLIFARQSAHSLPSGCVAISRNISGGEKATITLREAIPGERTFCTDEVCVYPQPGFQGVAAVAEDINGKTYTHKLNYSESERHWEGNGWRKIKAEINIHHDAFTLFLTVNKQKMKKMYTDSSSIVRLKIVATGNSVWKCDESCDDNSPMSHPPILYHSMSHLPVPHPTTTHVPVSIPTSTSHREDGSAYTTLLVVGGILTVVVAVVMCVMVVAIIVVVMKRNRKRSLLSYYPRWGREEAPYLQQSPTSVINNHYGYHADNASSLTTSTSPTPNPTYLNIQPDDDNDTVDADVIPSIKTSTNSLYEPAPTRSLQKT